MAMATIYHFPAFRSLPSHKLSFSSHFPLPHFNINGLHKCRYCAIVVSSIKKSNRASKKVRSDADLYNDIREFLAAAGLPENHVPTVKELSHHGRQDLANVVRRRGYKFIRQLLTTSSTTNIVESNIDAGQNENQKVSIDVPSHGSIQREDLHSYIETDEELKSSDQSYVSTESFTLSLQEKVAKFLQRGELDTIEGNGLEITNEECGDEYGRDVESEDSHEPELAFSHHQQKELMISSSDGEMSNGRVPSGKSYISTKEQTSIDGGKDLNNEKVENRAEIRRIKFLLHQKELELIQLMEQIEKEKFAFSLLQSKAETEISKAQKLISQKETELHAAEETLSGLKEVEIDYSGDGDVVELAGSFNGWDHKITMDLEPSSSVTDPTGSR